MDEKKLQWVYLLHYGKIQNPNYSDAAGDTRYLLKGREIVIDWELTEMPVTDLEKKTTTGTLTFFYRNGIITKEIWISDHNAVYGCLIEDTNDPEEIKKRMHAIIGEDYENSDV